MTERRLVPPNLCYKCHVETWETCEHCSSLAPLKELRQGYIFCIDAKSFVKIQLCNYCEEELTYEDLCKIMQYLHDHDEATNCKIPHRYVDERTYDIIRYGKEKVYLWERAKNSRHRVLIAERIE